MKANGKIITVTAVSVLLWSAALGGVMLFLLSDLLFEGTLLSSRLSELAIFSLSSVLMWLGSLYHVKKRKPTPRSTNEKIMRKTFSVMFAFFCVMIIAYTLFDSTYGRDFSKLFFLDTERIARHLETRCNFVPLRTVLTIAKGAVNRTLDLSDVVINLGGNFLVFTPFAFYLPLLFGKMKKFLPFFTAISLIVLTIEVLQTVTTVGSGDIDDYILNVGGTCLVWAVLRIKAVSAFFKPFTVIPIF